MEGHISVRITELAKLSGASTDEIRWIESKGYIQCNWVIPKNRPVRDYPETEVQKVELITKYRREGFELNIAYQKAMAELESPRLI